MLSVPATATAILHVDLAALGENIRILRQRCPGAELAAMVKADAYGLGLGAVAGVYQKHGTKIFFVATPEEGIALRGFLGLAAEICVLGGVFPGAEKEYHAHALTPVINSLRDFERLPDGQAVILHFDTGMRRLGLAMADAEKIKENTDLLRRFNVEMVMSHFACADEPGHPLTEKQYKAFAARAVQFPGVRRSLCNSAGLFLSPVYHFDVIRPGMAVYGLNPTPGQPSPMRPVVTLKARVLQIRDAAPGDTVGYGATHTVVKPGRLATVAIGYADGFFRALGNRGRVFWHGQACPVAGRVSMDLVTVDISALRGPEPVPGEWVDVLCSEQDADMLARAAGTIGYEILTGLGPRCTRRYTGMETL